MISISCVRTVETGNREIFLFGCGHKHRLATTSMRERRATVCLIESDRFESVSQPLVISEYLVLNETLDGVEVTLEDSPFSRRFVVHSRDASSVRRALNAAVQAALLEYKERSPHDSVAVAIGPTGAVLMIQETLKQDRWEDLLTLARKIEAAVDR